MKARQPPNATPSDECTGETKPIRFSIITVCFNSVSTIEDTLRSVALQKWPDVEHIVIDGGSTDGTQGKIRKYADGLSQFISEPDRGIYDAMNKGVALATGDIIAFLNSDDVYSDANVLSDVAAQFSVEPLDAVFGDVVFVRAPAEQIVVRRYNSGRFHPDRIASGWMPAHPAMFVKRAVFERFGAFRIDYRIAGDFEFVARTFGSGELRYLHMPRVMVRMQLGGASTSGWRANAQLNREVLRACQENNIKTSMFKLLMKYPYKLTELWRR